jgi:nitroreductase
MLCGHCKSVCPENAPVIPALDSSEFEPMPDRGQLPGPDMLMGFFRSRRSIRIYKKNPVEKEKLAQIVQAGRFIPTGGNRQPVCFVVLHSREMIRSIRQKTFSHLAEEARKILDAVERHEKHGDPLPPRIDVRLGYARLWSRMGRIYERGRDLLFYHAPAVAILHMDPDRSSPFVADAGLAAMQMVLMAEALGLGTCFCGFLTSAINSCPELKEMLHIPQEHNAPLTFMIGYPDIQFLRMVSRNPPQVTYF